MIRHIVTITLKDDAPADEIEAFFEELGPISRHPKAIDYYCGWNFQDLGERCDIGISCAFETRADFDEYMASPDHSPPGAVMTRIAQHWSVIDFDEDTPLAAKAQTRAWYMNKAHAASTPEDNAVIGGRIRVSDCSHKRLMKKEFVLKPLQDLQVQQIRVPSDQELSKPP